MALSGASHTKQTPSSHRETLQHARRHRRGKGRRVGGAGKVKVLESINPNFPEIIIKQPIEWVAWLDESAGVGKA